MMRVNGSNQYTTVAMSQPDKSENSQLNKLVSELKQVNEAYVKVFTDFTYKSNILTKKHAAYLYNKLCSFFQHGTIQVINDKKEQFCRIFRNFIRDFLQGYVRNYLERCREDWELIGCLIQKWKQFKIFCYFYMFLLKSAQNHYETSYKLYKSQAKSNKLENQDSIYPIPVISLYFFENIIVMPFHEQIIRTTRELLMQQREGKMIERQNLKVLFEILYSIGLAEMARIQSVKRDNNQISFEFYATINKEIEKNYSNFNKNPDMNFFKTILNSVIEDGQHYYSRIFRQKIVNCSPIQDFETVWSILIKQEEIAESYFLNQTQKNAYLNKIKQIVVVTNLQQRLSRQNSFKSYLQKFDFNSDEYLSELKLFSNTILKSKAQTIKILQNILREHILESGKKINEKINKRRQHMTELVQLKKSVNKLIEVVLHKDLNLYIVRDKSFKKIIDSIQASRNLADFIDWKVKQCLKNKLNDVQINQKLRDAFLILENLVASDSFLIYHQELLGRRLIQPLNEPRFDIEKIILKKISQQLGSMSINAHSSMIKDIERSQQITQSYSKKMPFARFKFNCRIISPQFWTDNIVGNKMEMAFPEALRIEAETIRRFYHEDYAKYLSWKIEKGFSLFEGNFKTGKHRFQSENVFMVLLFHIAEARNHQLPFWELHKKVTKIKDGGESYLIKCVKVLIENGVVLRSNPNANDPITQNQILMVNMNFKPAPGTKPGQVIIIKISQQMMKSMHESTVQNNKIIKDRQRLIQAVLVKLLKHSHSTGNNRTSLQQLIKGVREYQFLKNLQVPESTIKKGIEQIIARGYCERDEKDRKIYRYIT